MEHKYKRFSDKNQAFKQKNRFNVYSRCLMNDKERRNKKIESRFSFSITNDDRENASQPSEFVPCAAQIHGMLFFLFVSAPPFHCYM